ncbi:DUF6431 domain-containing protein [Actinophytocola sp.]|uniref:DUF6431 domain-containing protein n=1 Tax=Actinophytocola sp. TaxID=1872138 RepID=UPI002ED13F06
MRVVGGTGPELERALLAGRLRCPGCRDALRPWGRARRRVVRIPGASDATVQPRRARCSGCGTTHVLLPDWMVARRAYAAPVIWDVLVAHANGQGYRVIALRRGLPESTVRDWLRNFRAASSELTRTAVITLERQASATPAWRLAIHFTDGRLLANTNPPHLADLVPSGPIPRLRSDE